MTTTVLAKRRDDGRIELRSPGVGLWREAPPMGSLVAEGAPIGRLEVLGELSPLFAPDDVRGLVIEEGGERTRARRPVGYDDLLLVLDPELGGAAARAPVSAAGVGSELVFRAPTSGRFYARPGPDKPPFVAVGDVIRRGQSIALLEVMKTFSRIQYDGAGLPDEARVLRVVPGDGDDIEQGAALLELEPA